jgi:hypothetical protein
MAERTEKDPKYKKSEVTEYLLKDMEDFHKKFAELIVKECVSVAMEQYDETLPWGGVEQVKEHFGVEEK